MNYDVIVVGGGHAGCEAAHISAKKGYETLLITGNINNIANMPCNPSIGGPAKGIVVREIDCLGGLMAKITDQTSLQIKMLNSGKGPAVRSLRAQSDKIAYPKKMKETLESLKKLTIKETLVEDLIINDNKVFGVITEDGTKIESKIVILTTGTYLKADILVGSERTRKGPNNERPSLYLSDNLRKYGFTIQRLKTGTPPRLDRHTIDYSKAKIQWGDENNAWFSLETPSNTKLENQQPCYLVYTNEKTHEIIKNNLDKSAMYGGYVTGIGPRYCPSIEDKVVKFSDKQRHQLFIEPESMHYDDMYLQGFSTSMPHDVQEQMVHSIEGLENVKILKYAYAIEYDAIDPMQLKLSLESKIIENLFFAGQINGTSGYEEAACQGLMAGINATLKLENKDPLILKRNDAYIGVLIDDLINKGTTEPYRLLTSRAEYRLLLRHDNADLRLTKYAYEAGAINKERYNNFLTKEKLMEELSSELEKKFQANEQNNDFLTKLSSSNINNSVKLKDILKRPEIKIENLVSYLEKDYPQDVLEQIEISTKYQGYIEKAQKEVNKMLKLENQRIPKNIDYQKIHNLASEAKQKLEKIRPESLGQASRISGVNPADIAILMVYLKRGIKNEGKNLN